MCLSVPSPDISGIHGRFTEWADEDDDEDEDDEDSNDDENDCDKDQTHNHKDNQIHPQKDLFNIFTKLAPRTIQSIICNVRLSVSPVCMTFSFLSDLLVSVLVSAHIKIFCVSRIVQVSSRFNL